MSDIGLSNSVAYGLLAILIAIPIAAFIGAFLIGSIPFGYLIGRFFLHRYSRARLRQYRRDERLAYARQRRRGRGAAARRAQGFVPTAWALFFFRGHLDLENFPPSEQILAAIVAAGAVLGHCFSPWLRFRGGKGVATSFGALFALSWPAGLSRSRLALGRGVTRYSSVGSMPGSVPAPFALWWFIGSVPETIYGVVSGTLIFFRTAKTSAGRGPNTERPDSPLGRSVVALAPPPGPGRRVPYGDGPMISSNDFVTA